jgi:hypothetical protein
MPASNLAHQPPVSRRRGSQAKVRLIEAIRDALGEAEAYVGGKCAVECVRDALREEAEHLDEVGWHTRAQDFCDAADALDALNREDAK